MGIGSPLLRTRLGLRVASACLAAGVFTIGTAVANGGLWVVAGSAAPAMAEAETAATEPAGGPALVPVSVPTAAVAGLRSTLSPVAPATKTTRRAGVPQVIQVRVTFEPAASAGRPRAQQRQNANGSRMKIIESLLVLFAAVASAAAFRRPLADRLVQSMRRPQSVVLTVDLERPD